ncbi:hypothetical protein CAEBREN_17098 [Caenorhabditis brenneri]|uniref:Uncharacterized protein n=1 Tax=Caenorhabditis brenneri TaxID=135651 RepID=G0MML2_CAEBE|nr:hypothetical protein CAEBREN_17098 [Caenorhabditis brenneri]
MATTPMSYDSLKILLQYLEPNKRFGLEDTSDGASLTPGDVLVQEYRPEFNGTPEIILRSMQEEVERYESNSQMLVNPRAQKYRLELLSLQCRRDNVDPPFERFMQLTIEDVVTEQKQIHRLVHNKKHSEAMKYLGEYLFGGRRTTIRVKNFCMSQDTCTLRLPVGINFHMDCLDFFATIRLAFDNMTPIIHESSFPLKRLKMVAWNERDVTHPRVREAELVLFRYSLNLDTFLAIPNLIVEYIASPALFTLDYLNEVIENWVRTRKVIGTDFTINFKRKPHFFDELEDVSNRFNGRMTGERTVIIPITGASELYCDLSRGVQWTLKMMVKALE